jgi:DNA-directed RNA polymerase specialized sigma24 family protein
MNDQPADRPGPAEPAEPAGQPMTALRVRAALAQLSAEHRQVIIGMYYQSQSVSELAERLGVPEATVQSWAYYGLRQLSRALSASPAGDHGARAAPAPCRAGHRVPRKSARPTRRPPGCRA